MSNQAERDALTVYRLTHLGGLYGRVVEVAVYDKEACGDANFYVRLDNGDAESGEDFHATLHEAVDACWQNYTTTRQEAPDERNWHQDRLLDVRPS